MLGLTDMGYVTVIDAEQVDVVCGDLERHGRVLVLLLLLIMLALQTKRSSERPWQRLSQMVGH